MQIISHDRKHVSEFLFSFLCFEGVDESIQKIELHIIPHRIHDTWKSIVNSYLPVSVRRKLQRPSYLILFLSEAPTILWLVSIARKTRTNIMPLICHKYEKLVSTLVIIRSSQKRTGYPLDHAQLGTLVVEPVHFEGEFDDLNNFMK